MLEQSQQNFTISYFCRWILLHNLNDWQSAMEEQKMCWTREGIFLSHITLLLAVSRSDFQCQSTTETREKTEAVHYCLSWADSLCPGAEWLMPLPLLLSWRAWNVFKLHLFPNFSNCNRLCFYSHCLDFLFFFHFLSRWKLSGKKSFSNRETSNLWDKVWIAWEEETQGAHVIYLALLHFFPNMFLYNMTGYRFLPLATDG